MTQDPGNRDGSPEEISGWEEQRSVDLVMLLVTSAETSLFEPRKYPPYRLLDAAGLFAAWAASQPGADAAWMQLEQMIRDHKDLMLWDVKEFETFICSLSSWLVENLPQSDVACREYDH